MAEAGPIFIGTLGRQTIREVRLDNDRLNLTDGRTLVFKPETIQPASFQANTPTVYRGDWREAGKLDAECICEDDGQGVTYWLWCVWYEECHPEGCHFYSRCPAHAEDVK